MTCKTKAEERTKARRELQIRRRGGLQDTDHKSTNLQPPAPHHAALPPRAVPSDWVYGIVKTAAGHEFCHDHLEREEEKKRVHSKHKAQQVQDKREVQQVQGTASTR
jgi:hypothetical protein